MHTPITLPEVARKRGVQAFWQGLAVDVVVAVALLVSSTFMDINSVEALWAFAILVGKTAVVAAMQYTIRRWVDHSGYNPDGTQIDWDDVYDI